MQLFVGLFLVCVHVVVFVVGGLDGAVVVAIGVAAIAVACIAVGCAVADLLVAVVWCFVSV